MLDAHHNDTHDILANRVGWRPMLWSFGRALSFRDAVDGIGGSTLRPCRMAYGAKRLPCPEERRAGLFMPIIRYSDRVIEHLVKQYDDGKSGHCEIGQSTLCNMTKWCTMTNVSATWMSHLFGAPGGGVSDFKLYHAMTEHHPNKLLHPTRQVSVYFTNTITDRPYSVLSTLPLLTLFPYARVPACAPAFPNACTRSARVTFIPRSRRKTTSRWAPPTRTSSSRSHACAGRQRGRRKSRRTHTASALFVF